jgi:hypothetical protein
MNRLIRRRNRNLCLNEPADKPVPQIVRAAGEQPDLFCSILFSASHSGRANIPSLNAAEVARCNGVTVQREISAAQHVPANRKEFDAMLSCRRVSWKLGM